MTIHVLRCPDFLALFVTQPHRALPPEAEHRRYKATEDSPEVRARRRAVRLAQRLRDNDYRHNQQIRRWMTPKDVLED